MLLEKAYRIKKNADFQRIYKKGHSVANRQFVVYTCNNKEIDHFRLGISVSKKLGNAVLRNKIKEQYVKISKYISRIYWPKILL